MKAFKPHTERCVLSYVITYVMCDTKSCEFDYCGNVTVTVFNNRMRKTVWESLSLTFFRALPCYGHHLGKEVTPWLTASPLSLYLCELERFLFIESNPPVQPPLHPQHKEIHPHRHTQSIHGRHAFKHNTRGIARAHSHTHTLKQK